MIITIIYDHFISDSPSLLIYSYVLIIIIPLTIEDYEIE